MPAGLNADVTLTGPGSSTRNLTATQTLTAQPAGSYFTTAKTVIQPDPLVRTVFNATLSTAGACVRDGQTTTVNVTYAAIPSSNKLWTNNGPGGTAPTLGFAASLLGATGAPAVSVAANTFNLKYVTFDKDGNLWGIGGTTADPSVGRFPASALGASGPKTADRRINIGGFDCGPGPNSLAFDASGNLWVSIQCASKVVRLTAAQLTTSGTVTPSVEITGLDSPQGLAFDGAGNLWVANAGADRVVKYNASRLGAPTGAAPDLVVESKASGPSSNTLDAYHLAFDGGGNLWVVAFGANAVYRLTPADQGGTGTKTLTPAVQISIAVSGLLEGIAFDEGGGMWVPLSQGKFGRLAPAQLTASSSPGSPTTPERVISSPDVGYANSLALYPAPANLPLYHRLP